MVILRNEIRVFFLMFAADGVCLEPSRASNLGLSLPIRVGKELEGVSQVL